MPDQPADFFLGVKPRLFDPGPLQPGRVGQFGVVVIAHDIRQRRRSRAVRIDVRVRIDQNQLFEFSRATAFSSCRT